MKRKLAALLLIVMLCQALPMQAFATVGKVLTEEELALAYALTGLGTGGLAANANGAYHSGMQPNASWNASQLRDWLEEKLGKDVDDAGDLLSQITFTLNELRESDYEAYEWYTQSTFIETVQELYLEVEQLRETMRWYQDQLSEASNTIAEMSRQLTEEGSAMFDADRVRYSARIEAATRQIAELRQDIVDNGYLWEERIVQIREYLLYGPADDDDEGSQYVGDWASRLMLEDDEPQSNSVSVSRATATATRMNRLSSAAGLAANDVADAKITVITENEVAVVFQTGTLERPVPVEGVEVWVDDALNDADDPERFYSSPNGVLTLPVNKFRKDQFGVVHLRLRVDPTAQGFRDFVIEDQDLEKGEPFTLTLTPIEGAQANEAGEAVSNAADAPYVYQMSFATKDIMHSEYDMIYSPVNDYEFEIKVEVKNTEGKHLPDLLMRYYTNDGSFSKLKECWASPTRREGDVYVFKGPWKQLFSPKATKDQRPTFMFGKDAGKALTFPSQLVAKQSATEAPLNEGTGPNGGVFANVLGKGLGMTFSIPVVDIKVNFTLPFQQYLPKLFIDPGGYVVIYMGAAVFEDTIKKAKLNWKNQDARSFKQAQKFVEEKGMFANYGAQFNLAKDFYKEKKFKFMGESDFKVGLYAVLTGRWELDKDIPDIISTNVSLRGGFGVTLSYSWSWTASYPLGPVPVYICFTLGVSAGFAMDLAVNFCWVNGEFQNWQIKPVNSLTINVALSFSAQVGVGIKGFLEAWVRLNAILMFTIRLSIMDSTPSSMALAGAVTFSVGVTVFFQSATKTWDVVHGQIWPRTDANLLDHYMNAGRNDDTRHIEAVSDEPHRYPALTPEMQEVDSTSGQENAGYAYKIVRLGQKTFLFRILATTNTVDHVGVMRVAWRCLNPDSDAGGIWYFAEPIIETSRDGNPNFYNFVLPRNDYDFDVYADDRFVYLAVTCARNFDENGYPVRNDLSLAGDAADRQNRMNMGLYTLVLEHDGAGRLGKPSACEYGYSHSYAAYQGTGSESYNYDSFSDPRITYAGPVRTDDDGETIEYFEIYGQCGRMAYPDEDAPAGTIGFTKKRTRLSLFTDKTVPVALGSNYERTQALALMDLDSVSEFDYLYSKEKYALSFVGLTRPKNGGEGDGAIEMFAFDMNYGTGKKTPVVLERGDIEHIVIAEDRLSQTGTRGGRMVFYTLRDSSEDGAARNRLHGLYVSVTGANTRNPAYDVTKYTYDVEIPTGEFDICYLAGVPYLYWISTAEKERESDPDIWRVWIVGYDPVDNAMTDPSVFAEFTVPRIWYTARTKAGYGHMFQLEAAPSSVKLTGTGTAYVNAIATDMDKLSEDQRPSTPPYSLLSFPELLTPSATVTAAIPRKLAVKAGDFEDVTLGVRNEGNLPISTMDIAMYEVVDGKEGDRPVETVHINAVDPERSKVTLHKLDASGASALDKVFSPTDLLEAMMRDDEVVLTGKPAGYREEDYDITPRQRDWVLDQQTTRYSLSKVGSSYTIDAQVTQPSDPRYVRTDVLLPGSTGSYVGSFKIPEDWKGEKMLRMKVTALSVESNLARAVANAGGAAPNGGAGTTLEYVLNEKTGKLELQRPVQANGALKNAVDSGLYANAIEVSSTDMIVEVQDIEVKHRIYEGLEGERMLDIVIHNHAVTREPITLSCSVYVDGSEEPYVMNLPYYNKAVSSRKTQTITLPVSALVDDPSAHKRARVVVTAVGRNERAYANNEFTVDFDGEDPLRFIKQPEDVTVQEGEDVSFSVEVGGGTKPYTYQWQVWDEKHKKWVDLPGFTGPTLSRKDIEKKWNGCKFRCVITDATGAQIISQVFTLTVRDRVPTGDDSNLPLYLAVALAALVLLILLRRRARRA